MQGLIYFYSTCSSITDPLSIFGDMVAAVVAVVVDDSAAVSCCCAWSTNPRSSLTSNIRPSHLYPLNMSMIQIRTRVKCEWMLLYRFTYSILSIGYSCKHNRAMAFRSIILIQSNVCSQNWTSLSKQVFDILPPHTERKLLKYSVFCI